MSTINKSRNLFLEKEELVRVDKFTQEEGIEGIISNTQASSGIVPMGSKSYPYDFGNNFLPSEGSDHTYIKFSGDCIAYNSQGQRIFYKHDSSREFLLPFTPFGIEEIWIYVEYAQSSIEVGTVSLAINGQLTGIETEFTKLFRGNSTLVPNKIRIYERTESDLGGSGYTYVEAGTYEVANVSSDTLMYINASDALPVGDYVYSVVGAFSPGTFDDTREEEIYSYDSCSIKFSTTDPRLTLTQDQYIVAKVTVDDVSGTQSITDLRKDVYTAQSTSPSKFLSIFMQSFLQDTWDNLILIGGEVNTVGSGPGGSVVEVTSGYILIGNLIYEIVANGSLNVASGLSVYWEIYQSADTQYKVRGIAASATSTNVYEYNNTWRLSNRLNTI